MTSQHINYTSLPIYHYPHLIDYSTPIPPSVLYEEQRQLDKMINGSSNNIKRVNHLVSLAQFCNNYCKEFNSIMTSSNLNRNMLIESTILPSIYSTNYSINDKSNNEDKILNNGNIRNDYDDTNYNESKSSNKSNSLIKKKLKNKKKKKKKIKLSVNNPEQNKEIERKTSSDRINESKNNLVSNNPSIHTENYYYNPNPNQTSNKILPIISSNRSAPYNTTKKGIKRPEASEDIMFPYINNKNKVSSLNTNDDNSSYHQNVSKNHNQLQNQLNTSSNNFICNWLINNNTKCKTAFRSNDEYNDHIKLHTTNELVSGLSLYYQAKSLLNQQQQIQFQNLQHQQHSSNNSPASNFYFPSIF